MSESSDSRKLLLPPRLRNRAKDFTVLVPEYPLHRPSHRTDFRLVLGKNTTQNIEVEWATSRFRHGDKADDAHYSKGAGFVDVLQDDVAKSASYMRNLKLEIVPVDAEDFFWWFANNAPRLLGGTMAVHTNRRMRETKQWVIYVGRQGEAESDYVQKGYPKGVWAFRYHQGQSFSNVTSIMTGDTVIFTTEWRGVPHGRQVNPGGSWTCSRVDVLEVTKGFWIDYQDGTFENSTWDRTRPETKQYMHYFAYRKLADSEKYFSRWKLQGTQFMPNDPLDIEICSAMRWSNTQRGAPSELSEGAFTRLLQHLHATTPLITT